MADASSLIENLDRLIAQMDDRIEVTEAVQEKLALSSLGDFLLITFECVNRNMEAIKELAQYIRKDQWDRERLEAISKDAGDNGESVGTPAGG